MARRAGPVRGGRRLGERDPHRLPAPLGGARDAWGHLFGAAEQEIGILVYSGLFLADDTGMHALLARNSREVLWVPREQILGLNMDRSMRMRVQHYLDARPKPYLG